MRLDGFIGGSYQSQSPLADGERTVNFYVEAIEAPNGKNKGALYPTPGQQAFVTVADIGTRALFSMAGRVHAVIATGVYEIFSSGTAIKRGTVPQDNNPAQITYNGAVGGQLAIASGGTVSYLNLATNVLTLVSGVAALQVGMLDGYFLAFDPVAAKLRLSPLNDTSGVWDPTQYAQRSIAPDPWKAMITADRLGAREVWLIGEQTGEVWYDAGAFPFPFAPIPGAIFKYGTPAPFSLAAAGDRVLWLSQTGEGAGIVVAARGYTPQRVSNHAVETAIATYQRTTTIADAQALTYQDQGHTFYCLKFPAANATWCLDLATGLWHERGTWNASQNRYDAWHPRVHCYAFGQHLVGESGTGTISTMDISLGLEADGSAIRRLRRAPGIVREYERMVYRDLQVYLETGLGTATGQGRDPQVMLRTSNDGGKTFSSERQGSAGPMGAYSTRVTWTRLGSGRDRVFELTMSDPIPWRLIDCYVNSGDRQAAA